MIEELPRHHEVLRLLVAHYANAFLIEQQDWRVRRDAGLRRVAHQLMDQSQRRKLPIGRQCGLRFVQQLQAAATQSAVLPNQACTPRMAGR